MTTGGGRAKARPYDMEDEREPPFVPLPRQRTGDEDVRASEGSDRFDSGW
jgi:hypothetical protein